MKVAVITGGSKGIGRAIAEKLLLRGYHLIVTYRVEDDSVESLKNKYGDRIELVKLDQKRYENNNILVNLIKDKYKKVDILVCNAGTTVRKELTEITNDDWNNVFNVGLNFHFYLIRDIYDCIKHNSNILFIGSAMALYPHSMSIAYGVMKAAVHALALNLVKHFDGTGTRVNVLVPGFVDTEWQKQKPVDIRNNICNKTAMHRFSSVNEVAEAALFCIDNTYMTGSILNLTGGYSYK